MIKILFVCHGNICRSPLAMYLMRELAEEAGYSEEFVIDSAATSTEEIGNGVYPPVERLLLSQGIDCGDHEARQMTARDYADYDLLIGMDRWNLQNMERIAGGDPEGKIHLLTEWGDGGEVSDPWYTRDFKGVYRQIRTLVAALLADLLPRVSLKKPDRYEKNRK